jgi:hypothetical protein
LDAVAVGPSSVAGADAGVAATSSETAASRKTRREKRDIGVSYLRSEAVKGREP